jgi:hypothetical protein
LNSVFDLDHPELALGRKSAKAQTQLATIQDVVQPLRPNASVFITLP